MNSHEPATTESTDCVGNENPAQSVNEFLKNDSKPMQSIDEFLDDGPRAFQPIDDFVDDAPPIDEFLEDPSPGQPTQKGNSESTCGRSGENLHSGNTNRGLSHDSTEPSPEFENTPSSFAEAGKNFRSGAEDVVAAADMISEVCRRDQRRKDKLRRRRWEDNMILVNGFVRSGLGHKCVDLLRYAVDKFTDR